MKAQVISNVLALGILVLTRSSSAAPIVTPVYLSEVTRPLQVNARLSATTATAPTHEFAYTGVIKKQVSACGIHVANCPGVELQLPLSKVTKGPKWVSHWVGPLPVTAVAVFNAGVATASVSGRGEGWTAVEDAWVDIVKGIDQPEELFLHVIVMPIVPTGTENLDVVVPYQATITARVIGGLKP